MKNLSSPFCSLIALTALACAGPTFQVLAQDDERARIGERLERLERRLNELAERQEGMMRRVSEALQQRASMPAPGPDGMRNPQPPNPNPGNVRGPMPPGNGPAMGPGGGPGMAPAGLPPKEAHRAAEGLRHMVGLLFLIGILCNILLTVWIYTDIRKRGEGSGLFVALALVAGVPAAIIYSLVRIGDKKTT